MELTNPDVIKNFCKKYGIRPQKKYGQNFLIDQEVLETMVRAADLGKDDVVLEIGSGFGALTSELANRVGRVIAVEADWKMAKAASEILAEYKNVEIIQEDVLKFKVSSFPPKADPLLADKFQKYGYKIVANLPYQITSAIFRKFLENEPRPESMTVMVQKEVAERICNEGSLLSLSIKFYGQPEIVAVVPRRAFWPEPEVDSAILKISRIKNESEANLKRIDSNKFFRLAKIGFSARRKQLQNNLAGGLRLPNKDVQDILRKIGFDPKIRAQDLGIRDWIKIVQAFDY